MAGSTFNPVIIEGTIELRSRDEVLETLPRPDAAPSTAAHIITPIDPILKGRKTRIKSKEYVDESSDESRDEGGREEKPVERGRSKVRMNKGKGKERVIGEETGRKALVKAEPMDVDLEEDDLTDDRSRRSSPSPAQRRPKKSSMKAGKETTQVNVGNSEACERCVKRGAVCVYGGHVACEACRTRKQKCTGVMEDWRAKRKAAGMKEDKKALVKAAAATTATMTAAAPASSEAHGGGASSKAALRRSSRARSSSRVPEVTTGSSTPQKASTPKGRATPKRGTTPKPTTKATRKATPTPKSKGKANARSRSKSTFRMAEDAVMSDGEEGPRGSPQQLTVPELGQVPSQYVYLMNRDGTQVTGGVRVDDGERTMRESESGVVQDLQRENIRLMKEMAEMREEMRKLQETVVGLRMSHSVLISHHNAHTTLLERHRQALTTLTSQTPTPSDRGTPSDDGMNRLSMPPSRFSFSPAPSNSPTHFPMPPMPSPHPANHSMSPMATPRTARMFSEFIHPSMLDLNQLQISSSPRYLQRSHAAPDVAMEEEVPIAGPSHVVQAEGGIGEGGVSELVNEVRDERPRMVMPLMMASPASQTEVDEVEMGESSAMAVDRPQEGVPDWRTRI